MTEYLLLFTKLLVMALCIIPASLILHELGHLSGGLISGYRLVYIEFFGLVLWGKRARAAGEKAKFVTGLPSGQCVMAPGENKKKDPGMLIGGGCLVTLLLAVLGLFMLLWQMMTDTLAPNSIDIFLFYFLTLVVNAILLVINWFGKDPTNDGNTFRLVKSEIRQRVIYDRTAKVAEGLAAGMSYGEIFAKYGKEFFDVTEVMGSLAEELWLYGIYARIENASDGGVMQAVRKEIDYQLNEESSFYDEIICEKEILDLLQMKPGEAAEKVKTVYGYGMGSPDRELLKEEIKEIHEDAPRKRSSRTVIYLKKRVLFRGQLETVGKTIANNIR